MIIAADPPKTEDEILTEDECAKRLSVTRETLRRYRRDDGMPFVPLSRGPKPKIRYIWADVMAWLRAHSQGHPGSPGPRKRGRPRNTDPRRDGRSM